MKFVVDVYPLTCSECVSVKFDASNETNYSCRLTGQSVSSIAYSTTRTYAKNCPLVSLGELAEEKRKSQILHQENKKDYTL